MNGPGFFLGLAMAVAGIAGVMTWLRVAGIWKSAFDQGSLGFGDDAGADFAFSGKISISSSIGKRLFSLSMLMGLILLAAAVLALGVYGGVTLIVKTIERFASGS